MDFMLSPKQYSNLISHYSYEELLKLGETADEVLNDKEQSYYNLMKEVISDCNENPIRSILQFLGNYLCYITEKKALKEMGGFIFYEPIKDMPLYINKHENGDTWKTIVARWRLAIGK